MTISDADPKAAWEPPILEVLGDLETLTAAGTGAFDDGSFASFSLTS